MSEHDENDPVKCCLLEICCGPDDSENTLAEELSKHKTPQAQAAWLKANFDLAPKGLLTPLLQSAAAMGKRKK